MTDVAPAPSQSRTVQFAPPYVIAEMSGNHNGSLERALAIVSAVADAGADAIKLQTYTADTLTIECADPAFRVSSDHPLWGSRTLHELYDEAHTPWEWHSAIFSHAAERGLTPFSSPFDATAVQFLEDLRVPLYKIASAEIVDLPLIREVARTGKPMIISTGMATLQEIDAAMGAAALAGSTDITLLVCTAAYPATATESRLANIQVLKEAFGVPVGLSDHTPGIGVSIAAVALGAVCVEKHVTLLRSDGGVDSGFSLEPNELSSLCTEVKAARAAVSGESSFGPTKGELPVLRLRRSLYVVQDVKAGERVNHSNVRSIRPSGGLPPDAFELVSGRRFVQDAVKGTPLSWDLI
jgi:pseudaminic acid synthase